MKLVNFFDVDSGKFKFTSETKAGDFFDAVPPNPSALVLRTEISEVKKIFFQMVYLEAEQEHSQSQEFICVCRLVGVLENGNEVEISRTAVNDRVLKQISSTEQEQ